MYSIVPFTAGAIIAVGLLSAFAPMSVISVDESPVISQAQAAPSNGAPPVSSGKGGDIKGSGSSDGSSGPTRPNANTADSGDANKATQDKRLRIQKPGPAEPTPTAPAPK